MRGKREEGPGGQLGAGSAAEAGVTAAVSASGGARVGAVDGVHVPDGRGAAAVANWLAIAIAASISAREQVNPVAVLASAGTFEA